MRLDRILPYIIKVVFPNVVNVTDDLHTSFVDARCSALLSYGRWRLRTSRWGIDLQLCRPQRGRGADFGGRTREIFPRHARQGCNIYHQRERSRCARGNDVHTIWSTIFEAISDPCWVLLIFSLELILASLAITSWQDIRDELIVLAELRKSLPQSVSQRHTYEIEPSIRRRTSRSLRHSSESLGASCCRSQN